MLFLVLRKKNSLYIFPRIYRVRGVALYHVFNLEEEKKGRSKGRISKNLKIFRRNFNIKYLSVFEIISMLLFSVTITILYCQCLTYICIMLLSLMNSVKFSL